MLNLIILIIKITIMKNICYNTLSHKKPLNDKLTLYDICKIISSVKINENQ